jgi:UDP-N-acetylmuramate dehydrogenase
MMAAARAGERLIDRLPPVRGRLSEQVPLAPVTWFRVGGAAEIMFRPADVDDLAGFLAAKPAGVPVTVIGVASNLLVRDGGVAGVVIRLGRGFVEVRIEGDTVTAGAGALDLNVALACREAAVAGLEFLSGIPGTVGGGLRMNAGAYGSEIKDVLRDVAALDGSGRRQAVPASALDLSYRHCGVPEDWIFVAARFTGKPGDAAEIGRRMAEIQAAREAAQPVRARTGGSTFANPPGHKAWELIDRAGCRGLKRGGAMVSEKHANFLINTGTATAADLEALGEDVRRRVRETSGVTLEWEIRRIGRARGDEP